MSHPIRITFDLYLMAVICLWRLFGIYEDGPTLDSVTFFHGGVFVSLLLVFAVLWLRRTAKAWMWFIMASIVLPLLGLGYGAMMQDGLSGAPVSAYVALIGFGAFAILNAAIDRPKG